MSFQQKSATFALHINMKKRALNILFIIICLLVATFISPTTLSGKEFVVVIDPGHGGRDPGAVGKISKEKTINLNVALRLGKLIDKNCKDVKIVYTRKTDIFIPLDKRADIANNAKADLFISIHTNAVAKGKHVKGAETFTLGLARSEANLEIAKRENSVILIEDNYQQRYAGFNPRSSESYIMFEFIQDKHMEQSVKLASLVQGQFRSHAKRIDRGVHQAGFLVLRATTMPSILVELGYISNPDEEKYLNSKEGLDKLAEGIYNAFIAYKNDQQKPLSEQKEYIPITIPSKENKSNNSNKASTTPKKEVNASGLVFKIQILTSSKPLKSNDSQFKGLSPVNHYKEKGMYKYTYMESPNYNEIVKIKNKVNNKFKDAFIVAFKNGEKVNIQEAIKEFKKR